MDYTPELEAAIRAWAEQQLSPERLAHVRGVVMTAERLAQRYAPEHAARARIAGWLHDAAKSWDDARLLAYAEAHGLPITAYERAVPMLLHGAVGYALAAERFGLDDPALQEACALHTTGGPGIGVVTQILCIADRTEPGRTYPGVEQVRAEAERDLQAGLLCVVDTVLRHLIRRQRLIDPRAIELRNSLIAAGVRYQSG